VSCCPESVEINRYLLTNGEKSSIPYPMGEKISFTHSNGYEFELEVIEELLEIRKTEVEHCGDNYSAYEAKEITLQSNIPEFCIIITVTPEKFNPFLSIVFNNAYFDILINDEPTIDSMKINNTVFKDVFIAYNTLLDTTIIVPETILYNKNDGIIQIQMTNDEKYTIAR